MNTKRLIFAAILLAYSVTAQASVWSSLGQIQIPYLSKKIAIDLASEPLTVDDVIACVTQHLKEVKDDLCTAGHITKILSFRLLNYVKENPVNASIIAGGAICIYLAASTLIKSMAATRCPYCVHMKHGHAYIRHI